MIRRRSRGPVRRGAVAVGVALGALVMSGGAAGAATTAPYTDPSAVGSIGLCNQAGQQITSGSTTAVPFVPFAVSTTPAVSPYDGASRTAVLLAYQPQSELPPGEWSGAQLTSSSQYTNPSSPMVAATTRDGSLASFMADFSPRWDGFLQLRMYLGAADQPAFTATYPTLDIQVVGDTWRAVGGAQVNCKAGTAVSSESLIPIATPTTTASSTPGGTGSTSGSGQAGGSSGGGSATGSGGTTANPPATGASPGGSSSEPLPVTATQSGTSLSSVLTIVLIVLLAAAAAWALLRRRRLAAKALAASHDTRGSDPRPGGVASSPSHPEASESTDDGTPPAVSSSATSSVSEQ